MTNFNKYLLLLLFIVSSLVACKTTEEFSGYSYDPEGVIDTFDKEITSQHKRTIGFQEDSVWFSNEFNGARVNDVYRVGKNHYKVIINPEITPINNSPWYGFHVWSDSETEIKIELNYPEGRQRYLPTLSRDGGKSWTKANSSIFTRDRESGNGVLSLRTGSKPTWVSAQEALNSNQFSDWLADQSALPFIQQQVVGNSHQGRPLHLFKIAEQSEIPTKGVILVYNRQHPPEVPGYKVGLYFLEEILSDTELAKQFRAYFDVWAFPMINPDGVDNGHWRTNAAGVDLNRDWEYFRQPETEAVRNTILPLKERSDKKVFYGIDFHSTGGNKFYPINKDIETFPLHFTYHWADKIIDKLPELNLDVEPFDTVSPIAKNWTFKTFGVDAVTFEVWDEISRDKIEPFGNVAARTFMELMIREFEEAFPDETEEFKLKNKISEKELQY